MSPEVLELSERAARHPSRDLEYVGTPAVAAALGVGVSTVKRWVDDGILPAHVTAGGHRKLLVADIERFVRSNHLPQADLNRLSRSRHRAVDFDFEAIVAQLVQALELGELPAVRRVLQNAYRNARVPFSRIADNILSPALATIGHGWSTGRLDVLHEHRATLLCQSALFELAAGLEANAARDRPMAIGGAPEFDHYTLPSLAVQMSLLDAGWRAVNIGPNTPVKSLVAAIAEFQPKLVWLSVSYVHDSRRLTSDCARLHQAVLRSGAVLAIGGSAIARNQIPSVKADHVGQTISALTEFAAEHYRRPSRPARGRPKTPTRPGEDRTS